MIIRDEPSVLRPNDQCPRCDGSSALTLLTSMVRYYRCAECGPAWALLDLARSRTSRSLTQAEQDEYLDGDEPEFDGGD